jgi:hypothetical protein
MPPINATVDWPDGQTTPTVSPNPIVVPKADGATVIQWTNGVHVATFEITGLDASQFNPVASPGQRTSFSTNDANSKYQHSYTVNAVHTSGLTSSHDPKIQNDA